MLTKHLAPPGYEPLLLVPELCRLERNNAATLDLEFWPTTYYTQTPTGNLKAIIGPLYIRMQAPITCTRIDIGCMSDFAAFYALKTIP